MTSNLATKSTSGGTEPLEGRLIGVKATLSCPGCGSVKRFKNTFDRKHLDMLVVSSKVMAWSVCDCGELLDFSLEFEI